MASKNFMRGKPYYRRPQQNQRWDRTYSSSRQYQSYLPNQRRPNYATRNCRQQYLSQNKTILKVSKIKAGNLRHFYNKWKNITQDPWVLNTILGYEIEFIETPFQLTLPSTQSFNSKEIELIDDEIHDLLLKLPLMRKENLFQIFFWSKRKMTNLDLSLI